ncbi:oxygen-independent coproporphyrinogen III oxidase [Siccirubricoccus sp. KC 17139]|uniref:Coproporphyrinogen-III oxidase n=1 Tax=Siccirubricoccus soli TaxID=2899147 RepID=A0ABT1D7J4_9PROT|nr:oxygen-independent coproporphyrinogen III oxidase [Siccirubricoccus soli]MCO6417905.1 oxygen-independent coproporphyrinogen III oxidase [Siccirubricoccus soli]MCP2684040.1 oxygen-independent coproporphyrinogen III oxidase [Siccirubricoccus soli]
MMQPEPRLPTDLLLAEARVPRYTSYPTAAAFAPLEEARYRDWLATDIAPDDPLSLYVHVPFCRELCWYCGCNTKPTRSAARIAAYAAALLAELDLLAAALPAHGGVQHLHFGGGTPSMLGVAGIDAVVRSLRERLGFRPGAELAIELDPRHVEPALAEGLATAGFNRASLGVQDIAPEVQARIGRLQPDAVVVAAVARLRQAGIAAINLDLMYGLPGQSAAQVARTAQFAASLRPARLAVFGYAHVPWMKPHQQAIDAAALPDAAVRLEQAAAAESVLRQSGYVAIGLDHYARPEDKLALAAQAGRLRRNFQGYTTDAAPALLGLGASAIGQLRSGQAQNAAQEKDWLGLVAAGRLPIVRGAPTSAEERLRWRMIERVMCDLELDLRPAAWGPGGAAVLETAAPRLAALAREGLVRLRDQHLSLTLRGRRFLRLVAACFDANPQPWQRLLAGEAVAGPARHSAAV